MINNSSAYRGAFSGVIKYKKEFERIYMAEDPNNYHCEHLDGKDHTVKVRMPEDFSLSSALFWLRIVEVIAWGVTIWLAFSHPAIGCLLIGVLIVADGSMRELWDASEWIDGATKTKKHNQK